VADRDLTGVDLIAPSVVVGHVEVERGGLLPVPSNIVLSAPALPDAPSLLQIQARRIDPGSLPNAANSNVTASVRTDGLFVLPGDAGDYQVFVTQIPVGYYVRSVSSGDVDLTKSSLRVGAAVSAPVRIVLTRDRPAAAPPEFKLSGKLTGLPAGTSASTRS